MKTLLLLLVACSLYAETMYLQEDKQKHFIGSAMIANVSSGLAKYYGSSTFEAIAIGVASALLVGIAKEAIDGKGYGSEDVNDVYADTLGALGGSVVSTQFNWRF